MKFRQLLLFALALVGLSRPLPAAETAFTYQGQLQSNGTPANGKYDLTFTAYNASSAGTTTTSTFTNLATTVSNGLFTVTVDLGASAFTGGTNWLQIGVRTNGPAAFLPLSPRQLITPTPYALYSFSAGSVAATSIVGTIPANELASSVVTNGQGGLNLAGGFSGDGGGLTNLHASQLIGIVPLPQLPGAVLTNYATSVTIGGTNAVAPLTVPPTIPTNAVGSVATVGGSTAIALAGRYAYTIAEGVGKLQVFDVSTPSAPVNVGTVTTGPNPINVAVAGRYAYVVDYQSFNLSVVDVGNPSAPVVLGSVLAGNQPHAVAVSGHYAYVANVTGNTLQVFDVATPTAPISVGITSADGNPWSVAVSGRYAYVVNESGNTLQVFDVSLPTAPVSVGTIGTDNGPQFVTVSGRYAYVANWTANTVQIFDVSTPSAPVPVGSVVTAHSPVWITVADRYAYIVTANGSMLQVIDVSTPAAPVIVGSVSTGTFSLPSAIAVSGRHAFVVNSSNNPGTLQVFNLGGAYVQQLETGTIETGTLQTRDALTVGNDLNVTGGMTVGGSARVAGSLSAGAIQVGANGTGFSAIQSGQAIMPSSTTVQTNFSITFPHPFATVPKVIATLSGDPGYPDVSDTFALSIRALTSTTGFTINVIRLDQSGGWSQQLRVNWQAWQ